MSFISLLIIKKNYLHNWFTNSIIKRKGFFSEFPNFPQISKFYLNFKNVFNFFPNFQILPEFPTFFFQISKYFPNFQIFSKFPNFLQTSNIPTCKIFFKFQIISKIFPLLNFLIYFSKVSNF